MTAAPVAAAIIVHNCKVLMVRRAVAEGTLSWQFVSGEIETGETAEQAAVREAWEETGVEVVPVEALGDRIHPATGRHMFYIACSISEGRTPRAVVADAAELAEVAWCDGDEIRQRVPAGLWGPVEDYLQIALNSEK